MPTFETRVASDGTISYRAKVRLKGAPQVSAGFAPNQDDAQSLASSRKYELPEILVLSEQNSAFVQRHGDDPLIFSARRGLRNRENVEARSPQRADSGEVAALVGEKAQHRNRVDALHNLFVGEHHGRIGHRSPNVVGL